MRYPELNQILDAIEAELRRLDLLADPVEDPVADGERPTSAFGYGQMPFERRLGRVFLPNARQAVASGDLPDTSQVGVAAVRNFDGDDHLSRPASLLCDFDQMVESRAAAERRMKPRHFSRRLGKFFFGKFF